MEVLLSREAVASKPKRKLLDQVRDVMRLKHYSSRTERTYCDWRTRCAVFRAVGGCLSGGLGSENPPTIAAALGHDGEQSGHRAYGSWRTGERRKRCAVFARIGRGHRKNCQGCLIKGVFVGCVCRDLYQLLFTDRPKCYEPKQRFEGSACAKSIGPDRRKGNSPRAQVKVTAFCNGNRRFRWQQAVSRNEATIFAVMNATAVSVEKE